MKSCYWKGRLTFPSLSTLETNVLKSRSTSQFVEVTAKIVDVGNYESSLPFPCLLTMS